LQKLNDVAVLFDIAVALVHDLQNSNEPHQIGSARQEAMTAYTTTTKHDLYIPMQYPGGLPVEPLRYSSYCRKPDVASLRESQKYH